MKPGRELDALIAEKVMGLEPWPHKAGSFIAYYVPNGKPKVPCLPPEYSTDIAAAWQVVEKLKETNRWIRLECFDSKWTFGIVESTQTEDWMSPEAESSSAPHAICLAALKAVGVEL